MTHSERTHLLSQPGTMATPTILSKRAPIGMVLQPALTSHCKRATVLASTLTLIGACSGEVSSSGGTPPGATTPVGDSMLPQGPTSPGGPGTVTDPTTPTAAEQARAEEVAETDETLREEDPELFTIAEGYFPGMEPSAMPARLVRLTRKQLDLTTEHLLPTYYFESSETKVPADPLVTNYEYAANLGVNSANFTPISEWVEDIAARVEANPSALITCTEGDATCLDGGARDFVSRAFRGVTTDETLTRFASFFTERVSQYGVASAAADLVRATLTSPSYLYRDEVLTDAVDEQLLPAQRLQSISYALSDSPPSRIGLSFMDAASLVGSESALQSTINTVLASDAARDKLLRFLISWLEIRDADDFDIDPSAFPEFTTEVAAAAVEETLALLQHHLSTDAPKLTPITQSTESFISSELAPIYGLSDVNADSSTPLDPSQRLGIFTQPAMIASHSGPVTTRLVKRGVFFTRKVMCLELGAPPEGVDTSVPEDATGTEREQIDAATQPGACAGCHQFINPFGFFQESYDPIGRFRTTDEHGLPVDPSIDVAFLDEGPLSTTTAVDALRAFTNSLRFQQCFTRQLFRYYLGRVEEPGDDPMLRHTFFEFAQSDGQDLMTLLGALAGSSDFTRRSESTASTSTPQENL